MSETIGYVLLTIALLSLTTLLIAYHSVVLRLRLPKPSVPNENLTPITVLKPLKGVDPGLYDNLRAIVEQDHPQLEIIFGAEDPLDPALNVGRRLAREFPERNIQIVGGGVRSGGVNPKVRILRRMIQDASHEWVLISDSNVRPAADYVRTMQSVQLEQKADLVHTVLSGCQGHSVGARLEELQLNGWVAAAICFAQRFGHPCVIGKSMLLKRSYLQGEGALQRMQDILAEDYTIGAEMRASGRRVALAPYRLPVVTGTAPVRAFLNRHIRWGQMRRRIAPHSFFLELAANPTPFFLASLLLVEGRAWDVAAGAQLLKWTMDVVAYALLSQQASLRTALLIPVKDVLILFMWCVSAVKRTVLWRGTLMWVGPGSRLQPVREVPSEEFGQVGT